MAEPSDQEVQAARDLLACESMWVITCKAEMDPTTLKVRQCSCEDRLHCSIKGRGEENRDVY